MFDNSISLIFQQLVAPKKKKLEEAEATLKVQMSHLDEKRSALAEVQGKLQALNDDYDMKIVKKKVRYLA